MNLLSRKSLVSALAIVVMMAFPVSIFAYTTDEQAAVTLSRDQIINHDYFAADQEVVLDGTINGDAYVAGGQIEVSGAINGDLLVAGGDVTVTGNVSQNIRVVGGNVVIKGGVQKNVTVVGGNIILDHDANIEGNVVAVGGNVKVENEVKGDVTAAVGALQISSEATIQGNLSYWSDDAATIATGSHLLGETRFHQTQVHADKKQASEKALGLVSLVNILSFISFLILGALLLWGFPVYAQKIAGEIREHVGVSLLTGFVVIIVTPVLIAMLMMTIVGIPIALILTCGYFVTLYISKLFVVLAIGSLLREKATWNLAPIWTFVLGLVLYYIVGLIPIIGISMKMIVMVVGVGAIVLQKKQYYRALRDKKVI